MGLFDARNPVPRLNGDEAHAGRDPPHEAKARCDTVATKARGVANEY